MSYQGHLPDGSSVQKHSAGSCYPFIVYGQETPKGLKFGIINPKGTTVGPVFNAEQACAVADRCAEAYRARQRKAAVPAQIAFTPPLYPDAWGVS